MSDDRQSSTIGAALVVGGGIGGMQAALDLAEAGIKVYLAETKPGIGGVMAQLDKTFPTNDCAMCTMAPRLAEISRHKDVEILSMSEVERIEGRPGAFTVRLRKKARYVDEAKCTGCGSCVANCPTRYRLQPIAEEQRQKIDLAPDVAAEVEEILKRWKREPGPLMPILQAINARFNYFPEEVLRYVAREIGHPMSHLYRVATFYSAFSITPRGKHAINVCMGTTCYVRGSERLMDRFSDMLEIKPGETTPDRQFTLNSVRCIGCCGLAPAVAIGEQVYGKLTVKNIPDIVKKYKGM